MIGRMHARLTHASAALASAALAAALLLALTVVHVHADTPPAGCVTSNTGTAGDDFLCGTDGPNSMDGLGGNDRLYGLGGSDSITGGSGNDFIDGGSSADTITGATGRDSIVGGSGPDTINGGSDDDPSIKGGSGSDILAGGPGEDQLFGEDGNDRLLLRDGETDFPGRCGAGTDSYDMDLADLVTHGSSVGFALFGSCERITVGAVNEGPNVVISRRTPKVKDNGKVPIGLSCPASLTAPCAGTLSIKRSPTKKSKRAPKAYFITHKSKRATKAYSIDPGDKDKVSARLSKRDRKKLRQRGRITALATSVEQGEFGDKTTVQTLELSAKN